MSEPVSPYRFAVSLHQGARCLERGLELEEPDRQVVGKALVAEQRRIARVILRDVVGMREPELHGLLNGINDGMLREELSEGEWSEHRRNLARRGGT